ncbi:MAG: hypothetical protein JWO09_1832 [Bacteroidetes bacterium]|nr:hypothetical protein [Bacteroidota bacterium]
MTTQEFIEILNDLAGPVSPFDDEDYSDPSTIPNIRKKWFAQQDAKEIADCLKEVLIKQPPCFWPDREEIYRLEIVEIAGLLKDTAYARDIYNGIVPYLTDPVKRLLIIDAMGYLGIIEGVLALGQLNASELKDEELIAIACSLNMIGGESAIKMLNELRLKVPAEKKGVHEQIDIALNYPQTEGN